MPRFSKLALINVLESKVKSIAAQYGFDLNNETQKTKEHLDATIALGELRSMQSLVKEMNEAKIKPFNKAALINALELKVDGIEAQYGFDRNNGTAQLKGLLSGHDAAIAYGEFRSSLGLVAKIEDGSLFR